MAVTNYATVSGVLMYENRAGVETAYVPDPLANLIQGKDSSRTVTYRAEYWPYGDVQTKTGTNPGPWGSRAKSEDDVIYT